MKKSKQSTSSLIRKTKNEKPSGQPSITSFLTKKSLFTTIKPSSSDIKISSEAMDPKTISDDCEFLPPTPFTKKTPQNHKLLSHDIFKMETKSPIWSDEDTIPPTPDSDFKSYTMSFSKFNSVAAACSKKQDSFNDLTLISPTPPSSRPTSRLKVQTISINPDVFVSKRASEITNESPNSKQIIKRLRTMNSPAKKNLFTSKHHNIEHSTSLVYNSTNSDKSPDCFNKNIECLILTEEAPCSSKMTLLKSEIVLNKQPLKEVFNIKSKNLPHSYESSDLSEAFEDMSPFKDFDEKENMPNGQVRFIVKSVYDVSCREKVLTLKPCIENMDTTLRVSCSLQDFWVHTDVKNDDVIHILGVECEGNNFVITANKGLVVVNPDVLISSTAISSTLFCKRKAVLGEIFKRWECGNRAMLVGSVVHQIFQTAMEKSICSMESLTKIMNGHLRSPKVLLDIYAQNISFKEVENGVTEYLNPIRMWIERFLIKKENLLSDAAEKAQLMEVTDIEENFWSPKLGLKGKVDITAKVTLHKGNSRVVKYFPIELKTGKPSFSVEHQGQIMLYSMMMNERYRDTQGGLLLYLQGSPAMKYVEAQSNKQNGLLQMRNDLAKYLSAINTVNCVLPTPIARYKNCEKCPMLLPCTITERTIETATDAVPKERNDLVSVTTIHLSDTHLNYFIHWFGLIQMEAVANMKRNINKSFWNDEPKKRETRGTSLCQLKVINVVAVDSENGPFLHVLAKLETFNSIKLKSTALKVNDTVVVSCEKATPELAIAMGSIKEITAEKIHLLLDKNLCKRPNWINETFSVDVYNSTIVISANYCNLVKLMTNNAMINKLRDIVIDKCQPKFNDRLEKCVLNSLKTPFKNLNGVQQRAVMKVLTAKDYVLIQGMPGTGKTTTIVTMVEALVFLGKSVLLTSYTHSAVDNILLKLKAKNCNFGFLRMGKASKVHPELVHFSSDFQTKELKSVDELAALFKSVPVVATTCLSVNEAIFQRRTFDICIVDEASQVLQTVCLGPLFLAKTFVLVGDSKQLPPLAQSDMAKTKGICQSLFERLESPESIVELNTQYRMNREIMRVANEFTYNGKLEVGNDKVANATMPILNIVNEQIFNEWAKIFSTNIDDAVLFINTHELPAEETNNDQGQISNEVEAEIASKIVEKLIKVGKIDEADLGVISPYRDQIRLISNKLNLFANKVEINTVDQYQGRDKSVIIFSCVRSNCRVDIKPGEILQDFKRLNVALTRAKTKLILIGDIVTLKSYRPFSRLFEILKNNQILNVSNSILI